MFSALSSPLMAAAVALVPAGFSLWRGRSLGRLANDPALPERMLAISRVRSAMIAASFLVLVVAWPRHTLWTLPLLVVARMAASYPLRKVLYQETWSLGVYLWFFVRLCVGVYGFWVLLAATPALVGLAGTADWIVAALLAAILLLWTASYSRLLRGWLGATPIDDPRLVPRFALMAEACRLPEVRFDRVDLRGGVFANAVALPSRRRPAVVFSGTLLARLDDDEVVAICAHELAHLEYFNPRRLHRIQLTTQLLIIVGVALSPVLRVLAPAAHPLLGFVWPIVLAVSIALRARHKQQHETASDLRALTLSGDVDALIRGLIKLHALSRLPRRFDVALERQATHPSLAHRLQAIREASGAPPASLDASVFLAAAKGDASVTFHQDRLEWKEGTTATHILGYSRLSELRVEVRSSMTRLIAVDVAGHRWQLPLAAADIARAQAVMDIVDSQMAKPLAAPSSSPAAGRVLALIAFALATSVGQFALAFAALLALLQPTPPLVGAAGIAAATAAVLIWRQLGLASTSDMQAWLAIPMLFCGVMLVAIALMNRGEKAPATAQRLAGVLAACVALAWCAVLLGGVNVVRLHQDVRDQPGATVFPLALAACLALSGTRAGRRTAVALAIAGVAVGVTGSITFLDAFGGDPFLAPAPLVAFRTISGSPSVEFSTNLEVSDIRISPAGRSVALATENNREEKTFHIGRAGGALDALDGDDVIFVDDDHLLLLGRQYNTTVLREVTIDNGTQIARQHLLSGLDPSRLSFDARTGRWTVLGLGHDHEVIRTTGRIGSDAVEWQRWTISGWGHAGARPLASSGPDVLMMERQYDHGSFQRALWQWWWLFGPTQRPASVLWIVSPGGDRPFLETQLDLNCQYAVGEDPPVCTAFDGTRTRVFAANYGRSRLEPLAMLPGQLAAYAGHSSGWITGWWGNTPIALRLDTHQVIRITKADRACFSQLAAAGKVVAAVSAGGEGSTVRVYAIE